MLVRGWDHIANQNVPRVMLALDTLDAQIHLTRVCVLYLVSHSLGITMMANVAFTGQRDPLLFPFAACDRFF